MTNSKRIFVFGASGFIGKYLKNKFSFDNSIEVLGGGAETHNLLSLDVQKVLLSAGSNDAVIIAAGISRIKENSYESMIKNIQMIENFCRAISKKSLKHITFLSTVDVYGIDIKKSAIISESFLPNPNDYYSVSKVVSEYLLKQICSKESIPLAILRLPGIYGPGDNFSSTIGVLIRGALNEKKIVLHGKGDYLRNFVYVDDVYQIIQSAIKRKKSVLMNVATIKSFAIKEIVKLIKNSLPFPVQIQHKERVLNIEKRAKYLQFDCSVAKKEFPDVCFTDLKTGVARYIKYALEKQENRDT